MKQCIPTVGVYILQLESDCAAPLSTEKSVDLTILWNFMHNYFFMMIYH